MSDGKTVAIPIGITDHDGPGQWLMAISDQPSRLGDGPW
jgi:hypothetical protein